MSKSKDKSNSQSEYEFKIILQDLDKDASVVTKDFKSVETDDAVKTREKSYTDLTQHFAENYYKTHKQKRRLKEIFFWFIMILYAIIIIVSLSAIIISCLTTRNQLVIVIGSAGTIITSIIAIPTIIAKYLFPISEDMDMTNMIQGMQNYDNGIRQMEENKNFLNSTNKPKNDTEDFH